MDKNTYHKEQGAQWKQGIMSFGKHQGTPISELPQEYLEWAIMNIKHKRIKVLDQEYLRRQSLK
jgi:hypothetical protein